MIQPTLRAVCLLALGAPVVLFMVLGDADMAAFGHGWIIFVGSMCFLDLALNPGLRGLGVDVEIPRLLHMGEVDSVTVSFAADPARRPSEVTVACDVGDTVAPPPVARITTLPGQVVQVEMPLRARRRGAATVRSIWLGWTGPFGLMRRRTKLPVGRDVPAISNIRAVHQAAIRFFTRDAFLGQKVQRRKGEGSEFEALLEYGPGMDYRAIDWKHSARHHKLLAKEFRSERNHSIILAFDTGQAMAEPLEGIPRLDHAINAGLILSCACLHHGDRVGVFGFDAMPRAYAAPVSGIRSFPKVQHTTANLDYQPAETNFTLGIAELAVRLKHRSMIVLFTEFTDTTTAELMLENLGRIATRHLVVCVTLKNATLLRSANQRPEQPDDVARAVVAEEMARERNIVLESLRRAGVLIIEARPRDVGPALLNRYMQVTRRK